MEDKIMDYEMLLGELKPNLEYMTANFSRICNGFPQLEKCVNGKCRYYSADKSFCSLARLAAIVVSLRIVSKYLIKP